MNIGRAATPTSITSSMFCTTLRQRQEWGSIPQALLSIQSNVQPRWREMSLTTHDLALPIPARSANQPPEKATFLLLSASDLSDQATIQRIERFSMLDGGKHAAIIFLLHEKEDMKDGMAAFVGLQTTLMTLNIPIMTLPLHNVKSLPAIVTTFHRQLLQRRSPSIQAPSSEKQLELLKTCSSKGSLKHQTVNVVSDLTHGFKELSEWTTTNEGEQALGQYLQNDQELSNVVGFWREEYIAE